MKNGRKYSSIQISPKGLNTLKKKRRPGETYEQMLKRVGVL